MHPLGNYPLLARFCPQPRCRDMAPCANRRLPPRLEHTMSLLAVLASHFRVCLVLEIPNQWLLLLEHTAAAPHTSLLLDLSIEACRSNLIYSGSYISYITPSTILHHGFKFQLHHGFKLLLNLLCLTPPYSFTTPHYSHIPLYAYTDISFCLLCFIMSNRNQPTPPFNSPYQQHIKLPSLLQSPAYPSPARSDSEPSKFPADGLGLYTYNQSYPVSGPPTSSVLYPPSPQPTEVWAHLSTGASPLMADAAVEPWNSNFDHSISRSPLPWSSHHASHRSSISSARDMSIYSGDGSENAYPVHVKLEGGSEWASDEESSHASFRHPIPQTVAPERLSNAIYPYDTYASPSLPKFETSLREPYEDRDYEPMPYEAQPKSPCEKDNSTSSTARTRLRRNPTTPENANHSCHKCGKLFQRSYNHKTHLETHNPTRKKEHVCPHRDCDKRFVRKTDLDRHQKSVHLKRKDFRCLKCDAHFARKDTLRR